jgi:hypothetical protein
MQRIVHLLNSRKATAICFVIAIFCRAIYVIFISRISWDKTIQTLRGKNLLDGHGLSVTQYFIDNPEIPAYDFTPYWPPGYSVCIAPFLKLTGNNFMLAATLFDMIVSLALIFAIWRLCRKISLPVFACNLMVFISGCFQYIFISKSLPTDTVSLLLIIICINLTLHMLSTGRNISLPVLILSGFIFFLPTGFRYMYAPVSVIFPLFIILVAWKRNRKPLLRTGFLSLFFTIFFVGSMFLLQKKITGFATYSINTETGFFPENLKSWYPFGASAFFNPDFIATKISGFTSRSYSRVFFNLMLLNIPVCLLMLFLAFRFMNRNKENLFNSPACNFIILGFLLSVLIIFMMGWLAYTNKNYQKGSYIWNYINEGRYFAFVIIYLQLIVFKEFISLIGRQKKRLMKVITSLGILLILLESLHGVYYSAKIVLRYHEINNLQRPDADYRYFLTAFHKIRNENPEDDILVISSDPTLSHLAVIMGHKGVYDPFSINKSLPAVKKTTHLLIMMYDVEQTRYREFLASSRPLLIKKINESIFYTLQLKP